MVVEPFATKKPIRRPARPAGLPLWKQWDAELPVDHAARRLTLSSMV